MVIQINPNQLAVWRTPRALQIGIGSRPPIFENISNPQEQVIAALYRGVSQSQLEVICERVGLTSESLERLLKKLEPVLIDDSRFPDHPPDFVATEPDTADARRASLRNSASAEAVMRRRGMASVHLDSLGNSNFWLVFGLARAGIGKVICHDKAKVSILDSQKGGYPAVDYLNKYAGRFPLLHIKDEEEIGASGTMDFKPIFEAAYAQGMKDFYVEVEKYNFEPIESVQKSFEYLNKASYVK